MGSIDSHSIRLRFLQGLDIHGSPWCASPVMWCVCVCVFVCVCVCLSAQRSPNFRVSKGPFPCAPCRPPASPLGARFQPPRAPPPHALLFTSMQVQYFCGCVGRPADVHFSRFEGPVPVCTLSPARLSPWGAFPASARTPPPTPFFFSCSTFVAVWGAPC